MTQPLTPAPLEVLIGTIIQTDTTQSQKQNLLIPSLPANTPIFPPGPITIGVLAPPQTVYTFPAASLGFVIYNPKTQLFSTGYGLNKTPRVWTKIGYVKSHIARFLILYPRDKIITIKKYYDDCVVVDIATKTAVMENLKQFAREVALKKYKKNNYYADYAIYEEQ